MAKDSPEQTRSYAQTRMKENAQKAQIAESAYDKEGYAKYRKRSLDAGNEALAANERVKQNINASDPGGSARAQIGNRGRANAAAGRAAEAALTGRRYNAQTTDSNQ